MKPLKASGDGWSGVSVPMIQRTLPERPDSCDRLRRSSSVSRSSSRMFDSSGDSGPPCVQVWDFEASGLLIRYACLICDSCSSGQRFAFGFLQIPPRGGHPCRSANVSPCRVHRRLSLPSGCALPGASAKKKPPPLLTGAFEVHAFDQAGMPCLLHGASLPVRPYSLFCLMADCAAASRAIGTRKGEHET